MADGANATFSECLDRDPKAGRLRSAGAVPAKADAPDESLTFDNLIAEHEARIRRLVFRLLGWSDEAEDVVQEVFLSALLGLKTFRGQSAAA